MFIAIGVFSKRPRRATAAAVCVVLAALATAAGVRGAAGPHPVHPAAGEWLVVLLALKAGSFFRIRRPVDVPPRAGFQPQAGGED